MSKSIVHVTNNRASKPNLSDLYEWMPELFLTGLFLLGAMIATGIVSVISLLLAAAPAGWIVMSRARRARRNAKVLAEYDAELAAADARLLHESGH